MARLPHNNAPTNAGASLADSSSIEDLFSGLHISPAQARGIVIALLRISNGDSNANAPATVGEARSGIAPDDFEVLPPVSNAEASNPVASSPATTDWSTTIVVSPAGDELDHLLADDVILVSSRLSPLSPYPVRPLASRASAAPAVAMALVASPAGNSRTEAVTDADSAYLDAPAVSYTDNAMTASATLVDLANLTAAVTATALSSDDGEEDVEDNGGLYHIPASTEAGPFYMVTRGLEIGIFAGWGNTSQLVTGISNAVFSRVPSVHEGHIRMQQAIASGFVKQLHK
ncbi:uncharacterized protein LACBIDRAFT_317933 [Laccaria bicolor S238N-H82]|uniref:Predicted protein n=1 Tax=Laccaria bicolor (strain S238N-H82 / ATCC MYA-4686) TaxID=486041 RepID=B0D5J6_LACBS|nr:uncharacterized protein LACBIDRAFT_317933 [Laccaria bicolor S238N-H82]EDR10032.1 predicted protein [Laccaria bicolor S238N-H82]|eukprot:XP_001879417.1 predicted protein [Laccaria bicolor S238N-H82]